MYEPEKKPTTFTMFRIPTLVINSDFRYPIDYAADYLYVTNVGFGSIHVTPGNYYDPTRSFLLGSTNPQLKIPTRNNSDFNIRTTAAVPQIVVAQFSKDIDYIYGKRVHMQKAIPLDDDKLSVFDSQVITVPANTTRILTYDTKPDYYYITSRAGTVNVNLGTSADPVNFFVISTALPVLKIPALSQSLALRVAAGTNTVQVVAMTKDVDYIYNT